MDEISPLLSVQYSPEDTRKQRSAREPFTHNSIQNILIGKPRDVSRSAIYHTYKYIARLSGHSEHLIIPDHIIPVEVFLTFQGNVQSKQSSIVTIFSIWNSMMGSSTLIMPWALHQAGFGFGLFLMLITAAICLYTTHLIVKSSLPFTENGNMVEFYDICKHYFGRVGEFVAVTFSITCIGGAAIVYWVLMSSFLYDSGMFIHESSVGTFPGNRSITEVLCPLHEYANTSAIPNTLVQAALDKSSFYKIWSKTGTIPLFLIMLMLPLCSIKSPTFFTKFNSLGTIAAFYIITFVGVKASIWGINMGFSGDFRIPEFNTQFPALTGGLTLGYFVHNFVLSILHNQKNPKNNSRDVSIAYVLVVFTYIFVGGVFYAAFPIKKSCISQVFLDNLPSSDFMAFGARIGLFFQLLTVFPLIVYIVRVQCMEYIFGKSYPGPFHVLGLNVVIIACCVACACFYPHVGTIIRYVGALSGLAYIFVLPCLVYLYDKKKEQGSLSWWCIIVHSFIMLLGVLNLIAQFLIS